MYSRSHAFVQQHDSMNFQGLKRKAWWHSAQSFILWNCNEGLYTYWITANMMELLHSLYNFSLVIFFCNFMSALWGKPDQEAGTVRTIGTLIYWYITELKARLSLPALIPKRIKEGKSWVSFYFLLLPVAKLMVTNGCWTPSSRPCLYSSSPTLITHSAVDLLWSRPCVDHINTTI